MKKTIIFVLFAFVFGVLITAFILANPFRWGWMGHTDHLVGGNDNAPPGDTGRGVE